MARIIGTITMRRMHSPGRTISRSSSPGRSSMIRRRAGSSASSENGWSFGRSFASSGATGEPAPIMNYLYREKRRIGPMNKRLDEVLTRVRSLPDEQQGEIADLLLDFLDQEDVHLTPEQIAEIERGLSDDEPYASDAEVRAVFQRFTK